MPEITVTVPDPAPPPAPVALEPQAPLLDMAQQVGEMTVRMEQLQTEVRELAARPVETVTVEVPVPEVVAEPEEVAEEEEVTLVDVPPAASEVTSTERTEPPSPAPRKERGLFSRMWLGKHPPR